MECSAAPRFDTESWAEIEEPAAGGDQKRATYENMFYDGRNMLISLVHDVEFPTICAFPGFGFHAEIGLMMDIAIASDDAIILDDHYGYGLVPGDGIHSCFMELAGLRRGTYAMWMGKPIDAKTALDRSSDEQTASHPPHDDASVPSTVEAAHRGRPGRRIRHGNVRRPGG
jgi:enoyl-CoA hydratase/carnithine racemase